MTFNDREKYVENKLSKKIWDCEERIDDVNELLQVLQAKCRERQNKENRMLDSSRRIFIIRKKCYTPRCKTR